MFDTCRGPLYNILNTWLYVVCTVPSVHCLFLSSYLSGIECDPKAEYIYWCNNPLQRTARPKVTPDKRTSPSVKRAFIQRINVCLQWEARSGNNGDIMLAHCTLHSTSILQRTVSGLCKAFPAKNMATQRSSMRIINQPILIDRALKTYTRGLIASRKQMGQVKRCFWASLKAVNWARVFCKRKWWKRNFEGKLDTHLCFTLQCLKFMRGDRSLNRDIGL